MNVKLALRINRQHEYGKDKTYYGDEESAQSTASSTTEDKDVNTSSFNSHYYPSPFLVNDKETKEVMKFSSRYLIHLSNFHNKRKIFQNEIYAIDSWLQVAMNNNIFMLFHQISPRE